MKDNSTNMSHKKNKIEMELEELKVKYLEPQMSKEQLAKLYSAMGRAKEENRRERNKVRQMRFTAAAAAAAIFVILPNTSATAAYAMGQLPIIGPLVKIVTFREYQYEGDAHRADISVPGLEVEQEQGDKALQDNLAEATDEINAEIQKITAELIEEFEAYMRDELGYKELIVESEVLATTPEYFTLKLLCYEGMASGYEWNYYYTIDLDTGKRLQLKDIFMEGSDYIARISNNIKEQMEQQMAEDEDRVYWLNSEFEDMDFQSITEETSFYLNGNGNVVIGFNEGDVAPMYMGAIEFEIPNEVLSDIRK